MTIMTIIAMMKIKNNFYVKKILNNENKLLSFNK